MAAVLNVSGQGGLTGVVKVTPPISYSAQRDPEKSGPWLTLLSLVVLVLAIATCISLRSQNARGERMRNKALEDDSLDTF